MAFGTVTTQVNISDVVSPQPDATSFIVCMDWSPIVAEPYAYTQAVTLAEAQAGPVTISRPNAPLSNGPMYIRAYALAGTVKGPLSDEVVYNYDFRPAAPDLSLA